MRRHGIPARGAEHPLGGRSHAGGVRRSRSGSGQKSEIAERGAHDVEVSPVERGDIGDTEPFCSRDDRSVCGTERKVSILGNEFSDP